MGGQKYSVAQLERLRESPLVQKPDGLPAIEQWMDIPTDQNTNTNNNNGTNRRPRSGIHGEGAATGDNRADRPLLMNAGVMGHFGRRPSARESTVQDTLVRSINSLFAEPEDTVLGPPKLAFTSAHRAAKGAESSEKRGITSIDGEHIGDRFPRQRSERWTRDREGDAARDKAGYTNGRRTGRDEGEGWTNVKGRKSLGQEDFDRGFGRNSDRDRERPSKDADADNADAPTRRTGAARDKFDRWTRRDEGAAKEGDAPRFGGGQGGWRDRERDKDQGRWERGGNKAEEAPEWMDAPVSKEKKQAHTQEEFQRWKEQMRAKETPTVEKDEPKVDTPTPVETSVPTAVSTDPPLKAMFAPLGLEQPPGPMFGNWSKDKNADATANATESLAAKPKPQKKSRFQTMFEKPEESTNPGASMAPAAASTPANPLQSLFAAAASPPTGNGGEDADKEGFQRILQMLGGTNIGGAPGAQVAPSAPVNGNRQGGVMLDLQQSPPEDRQEDRPQRQSGSRTLEQQSMLENILAPRPGPPENRPSQSRFMSPDNALTEQFGLPRPESNRSVEDFPPQQPPPRNTSAQDAHLHAILNSRAREETNRDPSQKQREREFLLNLMQQPRATPPQLQNAQRPAPENQNMPFFDQGPPRQQAQAKGRGIPPPGFMEDPRFINEDMIRREQQFREASLRDLNRQHEEAMRSKNGRATMGYPTHDDPALAGLQRRNTAGEIPRQLTNMGIPSQPVPDLPMFGGRNPNMPPTPHERPNIAPPPGFGAPAAMRQPPGLPGPNGPQMPYSAGNTPLGHPPGFGPPPGGMRGGMFPGGPGQGQMPPQGPPQGYFPPPGYGPPMGMRGGEDPRMMMPGRPDFDQFGGPGPRQGRPPNMY